MSKLHLTFPEINTLISIDYLENIVPFTSLKEIIINIEKNRMLYTISKKIQIVLI